MQARRDFINRLFASFAVGMCPCSRALARQRDAPGCRLASRDFHATRKVAPSSASELNEVAEFRGRLLATSRNPRFDDSLGEVLAQMAPIFGVRPGFAFYDEHELPRYGARNALASPELHVPGTTGTVLFGLNLLKHLLSLPGGGGDYAVLAVCAHEFAHIRQFAALSDGANGVEDRLDYLVELHADFLAGWYTRQFARAVPATDFAAITQALSSLADRPDSLTRSHGTAEQRLSAFRAGQEFLAVGARGMDNALLGADAHIRKLATP